MRKALLGHSTHHSSKATHFDSFLSQSGVSFHFQMNLSFSNESTSANDSGIIPTTLIVGCVSHIAKVFGDRPKQENQLSLLSCKRLAFTEICFQRPYISVWFQKVFQRLFWWAVRCSTPRVCTLWKKLTEPEVIQRNCTLTGKRGWNTLMNLSKNQSCTFMKKANKLKCGEVPICKPDPVRACSEIKSCFGPYFQTFWNFTPIRSNTWKMFKYRSKEINNIYINFLLFSFSFGEKSRIRPERTNLWIQFGKVRIKIFFPPVWSGGWWDFFHSSRWYEFTSYNTYHNEINIRIGNSINTNTIRII